MRNQETVEREN